MKKTTLCVLTALMLLVFSPSQVKAETDTKAVSSTTASAAMSAETNAAIVRLNEIKAMDFSTLNTTEKKALRKEVRGIKSELKVKGESAYIEGRNGGIYMSVGAAILIVLLLILLL